ncbi:uncharacterized protein LOC130994124 [Salvia miltiorrhiza]|uniref:uncharacterized protein LOC130994124 n=1 Tax=Salvia miltiorrhiza TaxID=226208 RepID=UPI0025AC2C9D|nr:uncharacterized protein LOC130994124 [Salvia miltiorrhiza]
MEKGLSIGKQLENLRLLIHSASEVDKETQYYHDCVEAACKITGLIVDVNGPKPWRRPRDMHPEDDPFFYLDEVHNSVDAACDKVQQEKRKERVSTDDIPSFDLHGVDGVLTVNSEVNIGCGGEGSSMRNNNDFRKKANENVVNGMEFAEIGKGPDKETNEQTVHGVSADGTTKADDGAGVVANTSAQRIADPVVQQSDPQKEMVVEKNSGDAIDVGGAAKDGEEGIVAAAIRGEATKPVDKVLVRRSVRVRGGPMNTPTVGQKDGVGGQDLNYRKATRLPLGNIDANIPGQATKNGKTPMKSLLKKTSKFRSPFLQREISTSKQLTTQEKEVGVYALCANEDKMDEILFRFRGVDLRRRDTQSLKRGSVVEASIINAWSVVLNGQEQYRSTTSPTRFFAIMDHIDLQHHLLVSLP